MEIICAACYATGAARSANFADWSSTDASKKPLESVRSALLDIALHSNARRKMQVLIDLSFLIQSFAVQ